MGIVSVLQDKNSSGDWLCNSVNAFITIYIYIYIYKTIYQYTQKWLRQ